LNRVCSIFSQLLQQFPRLEFESLVSKYRGDRHSRGFSCWGQFIAMLYCQLARAHSLREICGGLACCEGRLRHLGLSESPRRSTLAYANQHRPWELYRDLFYVLEQRCRQGTRPGHKFRFKNKLLSVDSSTIGLCVSMYDWAHFQRTKGAVKLHLVLDHDGYLPQFAVVTDGKKHDVTVGRNLRFQRGTMVVFDKGYAKYIWWQQLCEQGVYFVTRLRDNATYQVVGERPVPATATAVRADQDIQISGGRSRETASLQGLRRIEYWDEEGQRMLIFVTNHPRLAASTIAAVYRERWQIETFFKSLKQLLKLKTFVGTSENAVHTQIWTALIVMLLIRWLKLKSTYAWSVSTLVGLLRQQLFVYRDLWHWLDHPFEGPPAALALEQLDLGFS
jgi:Transposase DDE domain/Domain of unknown function (DUF4372)